MGVREVLDQTQTALAGWWKILSVLDVPIEVHEPESGKSSKPEHSRLKPTTSTSDIGRKPSSR